MFNFVIFIITFLSIYFEAVPAKEIFGNFGFSSNYLIGKDSAYANFSPVTVLTIFSHMFIHSGFLHILSNMIFLMFLGIPFEEKVGPWVFAGIFFIAGITGSLFTALFDFVGGGGYHSPATVGVGASGAIFGVLGAFVASYPGEKIWFPLIIIRKWPVWVIAAIYFGIETLITASNPNDHIGHFAHIGGFIGGMFFIPLVKKLKVPGEGKAKLETLDIKQLEELATNYKLKEMLDRIKSEDEPDIRDAWLEEFIKKVKCPECGKKLQVRPHQAKCSCGYRVKY